MLLAITLDRRDYCEDRVAEIYVTFIEDYRFNLPTIVGEEFIIELHEDEKEVLSTMDGWRSRSFRIFPNKDFYRFCFLCFNLVILFLSLNFWEENISSIFYFIYSRCKPQILVKGKMLKNYDDELYLNWKGESPPF